MIKRNWLLAAGWLALVVATAGCGKLTIRTWVQGIPGASSGSILLGSNPNPLPITQVEGGFLGSIELDTRDLPNPLQGTLAIEDMRLAGDAGAVVGKICIWADPAQPSTGTVFLNLLGGDSSANATLNVLATTGLSQRLQAPPVAVSQTTVFPLGGGLSLQTFVNAGLSGNTDGLFTTSAAFQGGSTLSGIPVTFALDLSVTNKSTPPTFAAASLSFCAPFFDQQGRDVYYGINPKGSYLKAHGADSPGAPLVIALSDLGIAPGSRVELARVGAYSDITQLQDGDQSALTGVFSSSSTILAKGTRYRVPGAINAGSDVFTQPYWDCLIWPLCWQVPTDITQDFRIDPNVTVTVPTGAQYLVVAPLPRLVHVGRQPGLRLRPDDRAGAVEPRLASRFAYDLGEPGGRSVCRDFSA